MRHSRTVTPTLAALALLIGTPVTLWADDATGTDSGEVLQKMQQVNAQYADLLDKMDAIDARRERLKKLMAESGESAEAPVPDAPPARQERRNPTEVKPPRTEPAPRQQQPVEVGTERRQQLEDQNRGMPELPRVSDEVGGVLTPRGRLTIEPSVGFTYSSVNRIAVEGFTILPALLIGIIDVVEADRDTYTARVTGRYGITNRFEAELTSSWVYRDDSTRSREFLTGAVEDTVFKAQGQGLGDLELGLRYQFRRKSPTSPFLVGNLRIKSDTGSDPFEIASMSTLAGQPQFSTELPTGSGFWSINPSLTFIYPSDPVVFFGSIGYLWTLEDDKGTTIDDEGNILGFGRVDPGDAYRASFGLGLGLNENSSFSISYSLDQFTRTRIETASNSSIAGSDVTIGKLLLGYSLRLNNGTPLNLAVGIGTTDDAPDTDVTFRMPFSFGD